jgi:hypothetical protein
MGSIQVLFVEFEHLDEGQYRDCKRKDRKLAFIGHFRWHVSVETLDFLPLFQIKNADSSPEGSRETVSTEAMSFSQFLPLGTQSASSSPSGVSTPVAPFDFLRLLGSASPAVGLASGCDFRFFVGFSGRPPWAR